MTLTGSSRGGKTADLPGQIWTLFAGVRQKSWTGLCRKPEALPVFDGTE